MKRIPMIWPSILRHQRSKKWPDFHLFGHIWKGLLLFPGKLEILVFPLYEWKLQMLIFMP